LPPFVTALETTPLQIALSVFEIAAILVGAFLLARVFASPALRASVLQSGRIGRWPITGVEVVLLLLLIFLLALTGQNLAALLFAKAIKASPDRAGLEVAVYGFGFHAAGLLGWPVFALIRRRIYADYNAVPPPAAPEPVRTIRTHLLRHGGAAVLMALPLLTVAGLGWDALLHALGLPEEPQDLIAIFGHARSPVVIVAMLVVACVAAPINEEMIFRRGIFRFCRQRFGRVPAFAVSSLLFATLHWNWASFFPLAVFGLVLAFAYEATGDIRVSIIAHGLFNLNTVLYILSGLPQ
jgi:membrane protease YdiL (CAAX protease family)